MLLDSVVGVIETWEVCSIQNTEIGGRVLIDSDMQNVRKKKCDLRGDIRAQ